MFKGVALPACHARDYIGEGEGGEGGGGRVLRSRYKLGKLVRDMSSYFENHYFA